jgi:DNA-directed RNA polymerase specialized sigma24 family protein
VAEYVRKTEHEIDALGDEAVLDYIEAAREAGDQDAARNACGVLAFRYESIVKARVRASTPRGAVEDVFMDVMESAARSAFDGKFIGEYRNWLKTITRRRIADFHEKRKRQPAQTLLPDEHTEEEGVWVRKGIDEVEAQLLEIRELADQICGERPNEIHRIVIQLYGSEVLGYQDFDAASTATEVKRLCGETVSEANIHQIWRRFKNDYGDAWNDAAGAGGEAA